MADAARPEDVQALSRFVASSVEELEGLGALFSGKYYVTRVRHTFDITSGYRTFFMAERAGIGQ